MTHTPPRDQNMRAFVEMLQNTYIIARIGYIGVRFSVISVIRVIMVSIKV